MPEWFIPARDHEKGSFCDADSRHHYDNVSKDEAEERAAAAEWREDDAIEKEEPIDHYPENQRFNVYATEIDRVGYEYPAKHKPGG